MHTALGVLAPAAMLLAASACATGAPRTTDYHLTDRASLVEVRNTHLSDMNVFAVVNGVRHKLGIVRSMSTELFQLPEVWVDLGLEMRLLGDPIGAPAHYLSDPFRPLAGRTAVLRLESHISVSRMGFRKN